MNGIHFQNSNGEGLKFLEVASGTGAMTRFLALAFPKAQIIFFFKTNKKILHKGGF